MSTDIRVALVYQQESGTVALRSALANAGVEIAIECKADRLTGSAILSRDVDAVVVNLDPELEELLDEVTDALDGATQPVIYNDPAASSDLSGWDRARWMRHLSAKLKGRSDVTPPAPAGAQTIPSPTKKFAPILVAAVAVPPVQPIETSTKEQDAGAYTESLRAASTPEIKQPIGEFETSLRFDPPEAQVPEPIDLGIITTGSQNFADIEGFFDEIPDFGNAPVAQTESQQTPVMDADEFSFDALMLPDTVEIALPVVLRASATPHAAESDEFSLDALFVDSSETETVAAPTLHNSAASAPDFAIDGLFESDDVNLSSRAPPAVVGSDDGLADLDALFRDFEASQGVEAKAAATTPAVAPTGKKSFEAKSAPLDWSLEPVSSDADIAPVATTISEWRLDGSVPSITEKAAAVIAKPAKASSSPQLPADLEASLALADLKLLDDDFSFEPPPSIKSAATGSSRADDGFMDLGSSLSLLDDSADSTIESTTHHSQALADLDFALDLGDLNDDVHAQDDGASNLDFTAGLDDLDSLFESVSTPPVMGLALKDLDRVFVLGASIGGPESIKAFLSKLPSDVPAAFIIAQHMGAEFLEMMAVQLNAATQLSVRCPKSGERLRHGEVLVAPVGEQLVIDEAGMVRLSAANSSSPYSPSIDQLTHDAADRFGDHATLILFSGMGTDSIEGGRYLTGRGGQVWAQDRASCVIASMIDAAKSQGLVSFEGNPAKLAERVASLAH